MSPDDVYERLACHAQLYGQAFFGWEATKEQQDQLDRLWACALAGRNKA